MWVLRDGKRIRVDLNTDPCWTSADIWSARNLYAKFISLGYSAGDSTSLASAAIWKKKWVGTKYADWIEQALTNSY